MATFLQEDWPDDIGRQTFVGFRVDVTTGNLLIEVINDGSEISVEEPLYIEDSSAYAYRTWLFTRYSTNFSWGNKGHLRVEVI